MLPHQSQDSIRLKFTKQSCEFDPVHFHMKSVLLLTVDCLRADHVGCYGYDRPTTPHIDTLAEQSILFENGYANCPGTRWAFQSLHTGLWTSQIDGLGIPEDYGGVLARQFRSAGHATAGFSKNGFISSDYGYDAGFDHFVDIHELSDEDHAVRRIGRRLDALLDNQALRNGFFRPVRNAFDRVRHHWTDQGFTPRVPDATVTDEALRWIGERQEEGRPFFVWLHFMDAHTPYGRWPDHLKAVRGDTGVDHTIHPGDEGLIEPGKPTPQRVIDTYDAGIRSVDEQVGRLIDAIDDETIAVLTGDHGEEFGRNKPFHTESFYKDFCHVPLIVRSSDLKQERRSEPVQHLDIPPTLIEAASMDPPDAWVGEPLQQTERDIEAPIFFDLDRGRRAVHRGGWKLIRDEDEPELYRVEHGQFEDDTVNEQYPDELEDLLGLLENHKDRITGVQLQGTVADDEEAAAESDELSETVQENLENLGYVG